MTTNSCRDCCFGHVAETRRLLDASGHVFVIDTRRSIDHSITTLYWLCDLTLWRWSYTSMRLLPQECNWTRCWTPPACNPVKSTRCRRRRAR